MSRTAEKDAPECERTASCGPGDHTYSWPCDLAPGTGCRSAENDAPYDRKQPLHDDPWLTARIDRALDAIRYAEYAGLETALDLIAFAEDVLDHYETRPIPPADCHACRVLACEVEGNTADLHTCVIPPAKGDAR